MTHVVNDGLELVQATGRRMRDSAGAVATGVRREAGAVAHGVREEMDGIRQHGHPAAHHRQRPGWGARLIGLAASVAGAVAAFLVSRTVRAMFSRKGK